MKNTLGKALLIGARFSGAVAPFHAYKVSMRIVSAALTRDPALLDDRLAVGANVANKVREAVRRVFIGAAIGVEAVGDRGAAADGLESATQQQTVFVERETMLSDS